MLLFDSVDQQFKPWLLEVNHSPSFNTDSPLDYRIKKGLILETMTLLKLSPNDKARQSKLQRKHAETRIFKRCDKGSTGSADPQERNAGSSLTPAIHSHDAAEPEKVPKKRTRSRDAALVNYVRIYPPKKGVGDCYLKFFNQSPPTNAGTDRPAKSGQRSSIV